MKLMILLVLKASNSEVLFVCNDICDDEIIGVLATVLFAGPVVTLCVVFSDDDDMVVAVYMCASYSLFQTDPMTVCVCALVATVTWLWPIIGVCVKKRYY
jgi:hypothetical protein